MSELTHFDASGAAHMVDVSGKAETDRTAVARGFVKMSPQTIEMVREGSAKKGDVIGVARLAAIMGAKRTADLIPLCHPLPITKVAVEFEITESGVEVRATVKTSGKTGVEMEALTAVSVGCLTIYDMLKAVEKGIEIHDIRLVLKEGGKSGRWEAS